MNTDSYTPMTDTTPTTCSHERRPGTTVCLQCRNEAAGLARAKLVRAALIGSGIGGAVLAATWLALGTVLPGERLAASERNEAVVAEVASFGAALGAPVKPAPVSDSTSEMSGVPDDRAEAAVQPALARALSPALEPVVADGRTVLPDDVTVERKGSVITVHFDTELARTRRPEKFDRIVRATLPAVYGTEAETLLAVVPEGQLASGGDLLNELPERGVRLPLSDGRQLVVWPETRQGRDGPLVVSYRTVVQR